MAPDRGAADAAPALHIPLPAFLAEPGLRTVLAALPSARVVGGAVRDALAKARRRYRPRHADTAGRMIRRLRGPAG